MGSSLRLDLPLKCWVPSGKHTKNYGKSQFSMGKSTTSMAIFNSYVTNYQRISPLKVGLLITTYYSHSGLGYEPLTKWDYVWDKPLGQRSPGLRNPLLSVMILQVPMYFLDMITIRGFRSHLPFSFRMRLMIPLTITIIIPIVQWVIHLTVIPSLHGYIPNLSW